MLNKENPTRIYLIRHGEVANFAGEPVFNGWHDVALSTRGKEQLELQAARLEKRNISAIYSSPLQRSLWGAEEIGRRLNLGVESDERLREISCGAWEAMTTKEVEAKYPGELTKRYADFMNYRVAGGGENAQDLKTRVTAALSEIVERHPGEDIVIVAHRGVNRVIICEALGLPLDKIFGFEQDFGALNIIDFFQEGALVRALNIRPEFPRLL